MFYNQYVANAGNKDGQTRWANQLTWEIARHSIGEELVVYPLLESELGEQGHRMAEHDREDHQFVKDRLKLIESLGVGSTSFNASLKEVMDHLAEHIITEENQDFPLLEEKLGLDRSRKVAKSFARTKNFVPTRSHPGAPAKPPFETLAGLLAAPIDKLKDAFSKFPSDAETEHIEQVAASKN
ncbi:HHE domain-containing protein [Coprinopsis marcescibilis]|uniref:HHE domain-containing protein n=1 Tax=Coprinopsis marcescibilis TaxID=230819 RepID=A0A5C3KFZ8_COPMA|nr:HHE domain-containing protein [Coprinopsis marcescibilis]